MKNDIVENFKKLMIDLLIILWESNYELEDPYKGVKKDLSLLLGVLKITDTGITPRGQILENRFTDLTISYGLEDYEYYKPLRKIIKELDPFDIISLEYKTDAFMSSFVSEKCVNTKHRKQYWIPNFIFESFLSNTNAVIKADIEGICQRATGNNGNETAFFNRGQLERFAKEYLKNDIEFRSSIYHKEEHCHLKTILEMDWGSFSFLPLFDKIDALLGEVKLNDRLTALYRRTNKDRVERIENRIKRGFFEKTLDLKKLSSPNMEYREFIEKFIEEQKRQLKVDPDNGMNLFVFTSEDYDKLKQECLSFYDCEYY